MIATAPATERPTDGQRPYTPYGAAETVFYSREDELLLSGPAGTGKTRANLEKLHLCACKYRGMRGLILRKTRESLTQSGMKTFEEKVLPQGWERTIHFHTTEQAYLYPNGSAIVVGGLDKASKIMSTEYDMAVVLEARELEEDDWESVTTRLRNGKMPYQQLLADTNPDAPTHWLKQRANRGQLRLVESRHEDNPTLYRDGGWTPAGKAYIGKLDNLTGVRYKRLRLGLWVAAEGQVYEEYDPAIHLIDRFEIPPEWPRSLSVDFGYTNPFVCQWWAQDPDGRLYRYRELYMTRRLVEDHAKVISAHSEGEQIGDVVCDHDAEGRATLERHLQLNGGRAVKTRAAYKAISEGIQAVQSRLKPAGDGLARLFLLRDSLIERDAELDERKLPACTEEEIESYVWDVANGRKKGEVPVDRDNHGMDAKRYMVAAVDLSVRKVARFL